MEERGEPPNGSGKTTLFNSIVGHHVIDSGRSTRPIGPIGQQDHAKRSRRSLVKMLEGGQSNDSVFRTFSAPRRRDSAP